MKKYKTLTMRIAYQRIVGLISMCLLASVAQAQLGAINGSNSPSQLAITTSGHSLINWSIIENVGNPGSTGVSSISGVFSAPDNSILGTVTQTLQQSRNVQASGATTFVLSESLAVPLSVIRQAQQQGFNSFSYSRQFTDFPDSTTQVGKVVFSITGGGAGSVLSIRRVAMEYDDGRVSAVLAPNSQLQARAVVGYSGTGLLEYSWEIASPPGTQGEPMFVPLVSRKQYLLAGDQVVLQSPRLPTGHDGDYLLRLRIDKPAPSFALPILRYAVNSSGQALAGTRVLPLQVARPATDALLAANTEFAWQPINGAAVYQLEIYARPVRDTDLPGATVQPPLTGVLVPATKTQLTVGSLSRTHLLSGSEYYWRVVALSDKGRVVARSDFRRIRLP